MENLVVTYNWKCSVRSVLGIVLLKRFLKEGGAVWVWVAPGIRQAVIQWLSVRILIVSRIDDMYGVLWYYLLPSVIEPGQPQQAKAVRGGQGCVNVFFQA